MKRTTGDRHLRRIQREQRELIDAIAEQHRDLAQLRLELRARVSELYEGIESSYRQIEALHTCMHALHSTSVCRRWGVGPSPPISAPTSSA